MVEGLANRGVWKGKEKVTDDAGPSIVKSPCWKPLRSGFLNLNIDGAWVSSNVGGGGGVFRTVKGEWNFGYSSKYNAPNALGSELYALREGLNYARAMPLQFLEVETDAEQIMTLLNRDHTHNELVAVIIDVARLLNNMEMTIIFSTIPREPNSVAHY
ncbi:uncharacterized protein LOC110702355 [Chenopodium quinoa]|uniref:uncharacterized protein LOC110702355 n=1 Tax=Chenopodium quinoa TaxID=63459 RepID=UPI000B799159|nr:uncharacterized protein LOC110702355 [Chenopodium quinoa]